MTGKPPQILVPHRFASPHHRMRVSAAWRKRIGQRGHHQDPVEEERERGQVKQKNVIKSIVSKTKMT